MIKPMREHWKAVECAVGYTMTEPYQGVRFWEPRNLQLYLYADVVYASDKNDWRSISDHLSTLGDTMVGWSSKKQQTILLSSCKSKYISYGKVCQEVISGWDTEEQVKYCSLWRQLGALILVKNQQGEPVDSAHRYQAYFCMQPTVAEESGWEICAKLGKHGRWRYEGSAGETVCTTCGSAEDRGKSEDQ